MRKGYLSSLLLSLLAVVFLVAAVLSLPSIHRLRKEFKLQVGDPLRDREVISELRLPPVTLFTFRSLAINYLWIRAENLKDQGQYFDALHLARMICTLQPNLASVWDFQAWNMAYNISVAMPTAPQRWNWVRAGFELLRDEALTHNPENLKIYRSLAWIFQHKMGALSDDYHRYYKYQLAMRMQPLLTSLIDAQINSSDDIAAMAEVAGDWDELLSDPKIVELIDGIKQAEPEFTSDKKMFEALLDLRVNPTSYAPALHQIIADNRYNPALRKLDFFVRARALRQDWKLNPKRMLEINKKYGPIDYENENRRLSLDWRLPWAHAIYWAYHGLEFAEDKTGFDTLNLYRVLYQCLQDLYHYGNLQILSFASASAPQPGQPVKEVDDAPRQVELLVFNSQDLRMFPVAYQATLDILKIYTDRGEEEPSGTVSASANLCRSGLISFYLAGHHELAQKYLKHLRSRYPENRDYFVTLDKFVQACMKDEIETSVSPKNAANYIITLLRDYYHRLAIGDNENAAIRENWAAQVHKIMEKEYPDIDDPTKRLTLRPFDELRWVALMNFFSDPFTNPNIKGVLLAQIKNTRPKLYERVMAELKKQGDSSPNRDNTKPPQN